MAHIGGASACSSTTRHGRASTSVSLVRAWAISSSSAATFSTSRVERWSGGRRPIAPSSEAELLCSGAFTVEDGQITFQGLVDVFPFFTNHPVDFAITGGTGPYDKARGTVTVLILPDVPNGTDAVLTIDLH